MVIILLLAAIFFGYAAYCILKAIWLLCKAGYYKWFANESKLDEAFKKEVLAKEPDYIKFESDFDKRMDSILNKKNFRL